MKLSKTSKKRGVIDADNPPLTAKDMKSAKRFYELPKELQKGLLAVTRRGRPPIEHPKQRITLRLDAKLVTSLRKKKNYNARIERTLQQALEEHRI